MEILVARGRNELICRGPKEPQRWVGNAFRGRSRGQSSHCLRAIVRSVDILHVPKETIERFYVRE